MINKLLKTLSFLPIENFINVYEKNYDKHKITVDLEKNTIDFGKGIFFNDSKNSTQNITKPEDLVVLECVDRLLIKGYKPKNIILEKVEIKTSTKIKSLIEMLAMPNVNRTLQTMYG